MTVRAEGARHIKTLWRGDKPWHWVALKSGRTCYAHRWHLYKGYGPALQSWRAWRAWTWHLHLTPLHVERDSSSSELGVCFGEHTVYLVRHR